MSILMTLRRTVTMRPDISVKGVVTMEEHAASMTSTVAMGTGGEQRRVDPGIVSRGRIQGGSRADPVRIQGSDPRVGSRWC